MRCVSALLVLMAGACGTPRPCAVHPRWTQVATEYGEIAIPTGWSVRASQSPDPLFDLYSPDPGLAVFVLPVQLQAAETTLEEALRRQLRSLGTPSSFTLISQAEGWQYAEVSIDARHVFTACAVRYEAGDPVAVLALTILMSGDAIPKSLYDQAGGREMLCGVAASARRLQLVGMGR